MKKLINRLSSLVLAISMVVNMFSPIAVLAVGNTENNSNSTTLPMEKIKAKGNIEVEAHFALPFRNREQNNIVFTIYDAAGNNAKIDLNKVNEPQDGYYEQNIELGNQNIRVVATERDKDAHLLSGVDYNENVVYLSINLYALEQGNYTIEFSGKHFVTYKVDVNLENFSKRISFSDEKGMFEIGDINGDLKVDSLDSSAMLSAIENNDIAYDLNLDGVVDIADLNYITAIINGNKADAKIENTNAIINSENVSFEVSQENLALDSANISSLFTDEGVVKLKQVGEEPVELGIDLSGKNDKEAVEMSEIRIKVGENAPKKMKLLIETEDGKKIEKEVDVEASLNNVEGVHPFTEEVNEGTFKVQLGSQVAVKKVTIVITESSSNNLAEIAKVEFLNNVKVETKEPDNFYTPKNIKVDTSVSEQLTVTFDEVDNVTGYEIKVEGANMAKDGTTFQTTYNSFTVEDLKNYTEYTISVQSVNQEWRSGWDSVKATPQATRKPPSVDMVEAKATYSGIDFSWKDMDDTMSYNIYYRQIGTKDWQKVSEIKGTSYSLKGLRGATEYEAYITGNNPLGEGSASQTVTAKTLEAAAAITPKYKLINDYNLELNRTNHINDVRFSIGNMVSGDKFLMVDDNYLSYWDYENWQVSASAGFDNNAPIFVLDEAYEMDEFVITVPDSYAYRYKSGTYDTTSQSGNDTLVHYWNQEDNYTSNNKTTVQGVLTAKYDENNRLYYVLKLQKPIKANAIQFGLTVANNNRDIQISEVKFYYYDSLVDDVAKLFLDDLRVELRSDVTQKTIDDLRNRANTKDNGEYSPYRDSVLADLDYAEKILNDEKLDDVIVLNPNISNYYNNHLGFAMTINDYQPLGIVARPGDTLNVYVGSTGNINVQLVYTQYYAEANTWSKTYNLKKGQNIVTIDKIGSANSERGGSVYIRYTSTPNVNKPIKVRVSGGTKIPMLDISTLQTENEKREAISTYISNLREYNAALPSIYSKSGSSFDNRTSVLASTEIVTKYGLFSVSSLAVLNALDSGTNTDLEKIDRLYESTYAFDEMMELFYRQKGLSENATDPKDEMPKSRINIRYMRMFDGAFMYAGGYHVGIEYGSIAGLVQAHRNTENATGYFGWGISHEVGHQINQSSTVFAEVTNNVYALLAQTSNDHDLSRLEVSNIYEKIYNKVTSHTIGRDQNVFVQLGMYWQLHLNYDDSKTFDDVNSIYAKINHESRVYNNTKKYGKDDLLILFASKAANKNLIDFFKTWGLVASDEVTKEIEELGLEKETKEIYYLNDAARRYRLNSGVAMSSDNKVNANIELADNNQKRVTLSFNVASDNDKILGYEILRNGEAIAFVSGSENSYVDNIGAENNRTYTYSIVVYDYLLNKTEPAVLEEVKISHDGSVKKNNFTIESNVKDANEVIDYEDEDMNYSKLEVNKLIDGNADTYFNGTVKYKKLSQDGSGLTTDKESPFVIINLNSKLSISGIKYKAMLVDGKLLPNYISNYKVYVSSDKVNWREVKSGKFDLNAKNDYTNIVYFMKEGTTSESQLWTYDNVSYVKIEAIGNKNGLSGAEIDVIAPPGDNVDIAVSNNNPVIGVLKSDYCYLTDGCNPNELDDDGNQVGIIKKDSVIIQGSYRGSPSFNNILIADANDAKKVYGGYQLIFAELNSDMSVYEVADGTWLYVMTKEQYENMLKNSSSIRAYLYRVNDANELLGQRLTSTSKSVSNLKKYNELEKIEITDSIKNSQGELENAK